MLEKINQFIKDQGFAAFVAVAVLIFTGKVVWGMATTLTLHTQHDEESIQLLRVICIGTAGDDEGLRNACLDKAAADRLERRTAYDSKGIVAQRTGPAVHTNYSPY